MSSKYLFIASMDVDAGHRRIFDEVYDQEHIPNLLSVPGVRQVVRYESQPVEIALGGVLQRLPAGAPRFHAIYEIEAPEVLASPSWAEAVEQGRWPSDVRPFTTNRKHVLIQRYGG